MAGAIGVSGAAGGDGAAGAAFSLQLQRLALALGPAGWGLGFSFLLQPARRRLRHHADGSAAIAPGARPWPASLSRWRWWPLWRMAERPRAGFPQAASHVDARRRGRLGSEGESHRRIGNAPLGIKPAERTWAALAAALAVTASPAAFAQQAPTEPAQPQSAAQDEHVMLEADELINDQAAGTVPRRAMCRCATRAAPCARPAGLISAQAPFTPSATCRWRWRTAPSPMPRNWKPTRG